MARYPSVCVIGAGSSGIAGAKALHERNIPFDVYEKSDKIGGNWVFDNKNRVSSAYRSLHINTSRERMEYSDFPMPKSYPDFPHHTQIAKYFDDYVEHFGFRDRIAFETGVERAELRPDGVWEVEVKPEDGEASTRLYDAVMVANGHHWDPRWPEPAFPGSDSFQGEQMHSHHYVEKDVLAGKKVLVLGMGNSAMDIAVESSMTADKTILAARRGAHVIPKYVSGKPLDQPYAYGKLSAMITHPRVPWAVRQRILEKTMEKAVGRMEDYGLPTPDHRLGEAHPTISDQILSRITHGEVMVKPNIAELQGDKVKFVDGSVEEVDLIIYCTGYKVSFPFFAEDFISAPDNDLPLFRRCFHPEIPSVFFLSLLQPLGATMPIAEKQGMWISHYLRGEYHLPPKAEMRADIEADRERMFKRYVKSKRHTMQVDFDEYMWKVDQELKAGMRRAQAAGFTLPVEPKAAAAEQAGAEAVAA